MLLTKPAFKKSIACAATIALLVSPILTTPVFAEPDTPQGGGASVGGSLNEKRIEAADKVLTSHKWATTSLPKWNGTDVACYNEEKKTFTVDTPEKFSYACHEATHHPGSTIDIIKDIDMNGQGGQNYQKIFNGVVVKWDNVTFDGHNNTIYNLYNELSTTSGAGIVHELHNNCKIKNVTFVSPKMVCPAGNVSLFGKVMSVWAGDDFSFTNVFVKDGTFYGGENGSLVGALFSHAQAAKQDENISTQTTPSIYVTNCGSENCTSVGKDHVGGTIGLYEFMQAKNCYAQNDTVIAFGGHSGCLASCSDTYSTFENCWSNSTIYGSTQVGGFTSGCDGTGAIYENCFSSGVVEGDSRIGGFIGIAGVYGYVNDPGYASAQGRNVNYKNCYTTCMVGMNYQGSKLGGFVGEGYAGIYENCYAAGEVGSIDTDPESATTVGGFTGVMTSERFPDDVFTTSYTNCYYDMQTTAMKNRAIGSLGLSSLTRDAENGGVTTTSVRGIIGLTTDKMTGPSASSLFTKGYTSATGLYPQLTTMAGSSSASFRAQSAASTATVFCDTWDDLGQDNTAFDTVRDTIRPYAFSSIQPFTSNPQFAAAQVTATNISNIKWTADGNTSPIDRTTPVVTLSDGPYYSTSLSPGIEWVGVNLDYTMDGATATGSRRLRLIPTSFIQSGDDVRVDVYDESSENETPAYDHKNGFATTYLDAATLQRFAGDAADHSSSRLSFGAANATDIDAGTGTISGTFDLSSFNAGVQSMNVSMTMTDYGNDGAGQVQGQPATAHVVDLYGKLNANSRFAAGDSGMYTLAYKATVPDGRYLSASKKLIVTGPYSVVYNYNYSGLLAGNRISPNSIFAAKYNLQSFDGFELDGYGSSPVRDGWRFSYWSLDPEGTKPVTQSWFDAYEERYGALTTNIDVFAQWDRDVPDASEFSLELDPTIGTYPGLTKGEKKQETGKPGYRIVVESPVAPGMYDFDDWAVDELAGGTFAPSGTEGYWFFTFGDDDASIHAEYSPLFEDKGLVVSGTKTLIDGNLTPGRFSFKLTPMADVLADPRAVQCQLAGGVSFRGDGIDDSRQAILHFYTENGYFSDSQSSTQHSTAMTIRNENGELLPEEKRRIDGFGTYYPQPFTNDMFYAKMEWVPFAPEAQPISGDMSFTMVFTPDICPVAPDMPDEPVPLSAMDAMRVDDDSADDGDVHADGMGGNELVTQQDDAEALDDDTDDVSSADNAGDADELGLIATNTLDGSFSFTDIEWESIPYYEDAQDGCRYFTFMLSEVDDEQPGIIYDDSEYLVKVKTVQYNGDYLPLDISYYQYETWWNSVDEPSFANTQQWIAMPTTGTDGIDLLAKIGAFCVVLSVIGYGIMRVATRRKREEYERAV